MTSNLNINDGPKLEEQFLHNLRKLSTLAKSLAEGQKQPFFDFLTTLHEQTLSLPPHMSKFKTEMYYSFGLLFISYLNKQNIREEIEDRIDLSRLYTFELKGTDKEILAYFSDLAKAIFDANNPGVQERNYIIVEQVNQYIRKHLMNELSLNIIGQAVGYNPSYLSRVYKNISGIGIAEYIMWQRMSLAKNLLKNSKLRINDIAKKSGFITEAHFFRVFKKSTGMTPCEYRSHDVNRND